MTIYIINPQPMMRLALEMLVHKCAPGSSVVGISTPEQLANHVSINGEPRLLILGMDSTNNMRNINAVCKKYLGRVILMGHEDKKEIGALGYENTYINYRSKQKIILAAFMEKLDIFAPPKKISRAQTRILIHLEQGKTTQQIASIYSLSAYTITAQKRILFMELGVKNRIKAVTVARQHGYLLPQFPLN